MAFATGPFTSPYLIGNVGQNRFRLFSDAGNGDVEALNALTTGPNGPMAVQSGTVTTAATQAFTLGATAAANVLAVNSPAVGDGVFVRVKVRAFGSVAADGAYLEAGITVVNVAGTLTSVGAVTVFATNIGASITSLVLTNAAGVLTLTVVQANTNVITYRCEWQAEALSGAF